MLRSLLALTMVVGLLAVPARLAFAQDVCAQRDASTGVCLWMMSAMGWLTRSQPSRSSTGGSTCTTLFGRACRAGWTTRSGDLPYALVLRAPHDTAAVAFPARSVGHAARRAPGRAGLLVHAVDQRRLRRRRYPIIWLPVAPAVDLVALARQGSHR